MRQKSHGPAPPDHYSFRELLPNTGYCISFFLFVKTRQERFPCPAMEGRLHKGKLVAKGLDNRTRLEITLRPGPRRWYNPFPVQGVPKCLAMSFDLCALALRKAPSV
jgi:hypothetical protein